MAKLSISEAIRRSGVSRSSFYSKYVSKGLISVSEDKGKKYIDSSEMLRVFGELKGEQVQDSPRQSKGDTLGQPDTSKDEQIKLLKQQLAKAEEREGFYHSQITNLTNRLEAPKHNPNPNPNPIVRWWRGLSV